MSGLELSRRTTMRWMMAAAGLLALPLRAEAAAAVGFGTDPNLVHPAPAPWPLILTPTQRATVRAAADLILPKDERSPSAGSLGVDAFVDEWVSAPYPRQQKDGEIVIPAIDWLDTESTRRFSAGFAAASDVQRRAILDDIAFRDKVKPELGKAASGFGALRGLVIAGFYTLPEGIADLGFVGNSPIAGPYPGPSDEARAHLTAQLRKLGLPDPA